VLTFEKVILAGDSAGGNLVLGVLSHISYPHPPIPLLPVSSPFQGAILHSPWVLLSASSPSYTRNRFKDFMTGSTLTRWAAAYQGSAVPDAYNNPLVVAPEWWAGLQVRDVLIEAGSDEIMIDDIRAFAERFTEGFGQEQTRTIVVEGDVHDEFIIDYMFGHKDREQIRVLKEWICDRM
jgi:acetyl esterase/lipase